ncbi:MAG TPA: LysR family transcriptional regulator [Gammaproteobacteria bacterium]
MIPCTLRQLEVFLAAAHDCHFARTALRLGISQPAVSAHIAALERQIGKELFIRRKGFRPTLSMHGIALLREAHALSSVGSKICDFAAAGARRKGVSRALVRLCGAEHLLTAIKSKLRAFHERQPALALECQHVDPPQRGARLVKTGKADLMIHTVNNPHEYGLHAEVLRVERLRLYAGRRFLPARHAEPEEIAALPFILPLEGSPQDDLVQRTLIGSGILCTNVVVRAQYWEVLRDMAKAGYGVAPLFETMLTARDREALITFDVELPALYRTLFRRFDAPSPALRAAESFLRHTLSR